MGNFQTKMALLVFSLVFAGCTTPFVEVTVNGEDRSQAAGGGGGDCFYPCWGGGGAKFGSSGQEAKVLLVEKDQDVYHMQGPDGHDIHIVVPSATNPNINSGDTVVITKNGTKWDIKKKP
ncbi:MAG: hypothetical protein WD425_13660 [Nitrospirales bacterium]